MKGVAMELLIFSAETIRHLPLGKYVIQCAYVQDRFHVLTLRRGKCGGVVKLERQIWPFDIGECMRESPSLFQSAPPEKHYRALALSPGKMLGVAVEEISSGERESVLGEDISIQGHLTEPIPSLNLSATEEPAQSLFSDSSPPTKLEFA